MTDLTSNEELRPAAEIREQLADLREIKASIDDSHMDFGFAGYIDRCSIEAQETALLEELNAAELREHNAAAEFILEGEPLHSGEAPARLLGAFLDKLQSLVYAVGQVQAGSATDRARFPRNVVAANRLYVQPQFVSGSFGFRVRVPSKEELGELVETGGETVLHKVCHALGDENPSGDVMTLLSHSRVRSHYESIATLLARENVDLSMRQRSERGRLRLSSSAARERLEWLQQLQVTEETIERTGELVGGNIQRDQFELKAGDETIRGGLSQQAKEDLKGFHLGDTVTATLRVMITEHEDALTEQKSDYVAQRFVPYNTLPHQNEERQ